MTLKWYLFTFFLNTFFAVFFWHISKHWPFSYHFIFSHCQGYSILTFGAFGNTLFKFTRSTIRLIGIFLFCIIGSLAGKFLGPVVLGFELVTKQESVFLFILNIMVISIILGFIYYWEGIAFTNSKIQEEKKKQLHMEQKMIQAQLKLLHTQIEPEFLFKILNYILSLLDTMPDKAKAIQMSLIQYLRMTLAKFKKELHSVAQEIEMIKTYLDILLLPHENHLSYHIDIPEKIMNNSIPAMLVHSFVDKIASLIPVSDHNKVLNIRGKEGTDGLRFEISGSNMDGVFSAEVMSHLEVINERLKKIYGDAGKLILTPDSSGDRKFILKFPHIEMRSI